MYIMAYLYSSLDVVTTHNLNLHVVLHHPKTVNYAFQRYDWPPNLEMDHVTLTMATWG